MVHPHTHPARVASQVKHPVGDRLAQLWHHEVADSNRRGLSLRSPFPPAVLQKGTGDPEALTAAEARLGAANEANQAGLERWLALR